MSPSFIVLPSSRVEEVQGIADDSGFKILKPQPTICDQNENAAVEEFPFTDEDWELVKQASWAIVNASAAEVEVLLASCHGKMERILDDLTATYGEHPILIETAADFAADSHERLDLYDQAKNLAERHGLSTYTIILSMARVLIEDLAQNAAAHSLLLSCREEVAAQGDEGERHDWQELLQKCEPLPE